MKYLIQVLLIFTVRVVFAADNFTCVAVDQNAPLGTSCVTTGAIKTGTLAIRHPFKSKKVTTLEFTPTSFTRVSVKQNYKIKNEQQEGDFQTTTLGWRDDSTQITWFDFAANADNFQGRGIDVTDAVHYCENLHQELPMRDDFIEAEKHGIREVMKDFVSIDNSGIFNWTKATVSRFWSKTPQGYWPSLLGPVLRGRTNPPGVAIDYFALDAKSGEIANWYYDAYKPRAARCILRN